MRLVSGYPLYPVQPPTVLTQYRHLSLLLSTCLATEAGSRAAEQVDIRDRPDALVPMEEERLVDFRRGEGFEVQARLSKQREMHASVAVALIQPGDQERDVPVWSRNCGRNDSQQGAVIVLTGPARENTTPLCLANQCLSNSLSLSSPPAIAKPSSAPMPHHHVTFPESPFQRVQLLHIT